MLESLPDVSAEAVPLAEICKIELAGGSGDSLRQARLHHELGLLCSDANEALRHHLRAIELYPEHRPSLVVARRMLLAVRNIGDALPLFDAELRLAQSAEERAEIHFKRGRAIEEHQRDLDAARASYRQAVELAPGSLRYLKALHQVDVSLGDWAAAASTREKEQNAVSTDPQLRAALLVDQAVQLESRLDQAPLASELYQRALDTDSDVSGALPSLKRLHHKQERWRDLVAVLELEAARTSDERVKSSALMQIGQIQSLRLGNRNAAIEALARAMEVDRRDRLVLGALAGLYRDADEAQHLAHVLAHEVETLREPKEQVVVMIRIANIYDSVLKRDDDARQWYEAALRLMPAHAVALAALGALYRRTESWQSLVVMNLAAAEAEEDSAMRARYHVEIADIFEEQVEEPQQAMRHYDLALSFDPRHEGAFKALVRLYADHGHYRQLIELHQRAVDLADEDYLREAHYFRMAEVYEFDLGTPEHALPMYKLVLQSTPGHLGALHALQRAAESAEAFDELVEALEVEADGSTNRERTIAIYMRAGRVLSERLEQHEKALIRFKKVHRIAPDYTPALSAMAVTFRLLGRHRDELDVREDWLRLTTDKREKASLLHGMAEISEFRLGDQERALRDYRRAVEADPSLDEPFRALCRHLEKLKDYPGLVSALRSRLGGVSDPMDRARVNYRMGEVYEVHTGQLKLAERCYVDALRESFELRSATDALARVRHQLNAWQEQVSDLLNDSGAVGDVRLAIDSLLRAGEINRTKLDQIPDAIDCFGAVLVKDAANLAALLALEECYRQVGSWTELARTYDMLAHVLKDNAAKTAVLVELARLQKDVLGSTPMDVQATLYRVLQIEAGNDYALRALEQLALEQEDAALLSDVDARFARLASDSASAATHYVRLGRGLLSSDVQRAHDAFHQALNLEPDNIAALSGLRTSAEHLGDSEALCRALEGEAAWTDDGRRAAALLVASSEVHMRQASGWQLAVDCAKTALSRDPDCRGAARMLVQLMRPNGQADALIELLSGAANLARSAACVVSLWEQVARLHAEDKGDLVAAIARLTPLHERGLETVSSAELLGNLYEQRSLWFEAADAYTRSHELGPSSEALVRVEFARGRLYAQKLDQPELAVTCLEHVLGVDKMHPGALTLLLQLHQDAGRLEKAATVAQRLVALHHEPAPRAAILVTFAKLQLALNQRAGAAASLREAVGLTGAVGDAAEAYKPLLGVDEPWARYAEALRRHLANLGVGRAVGHAEPSFLELARVEHDVLGDAASALNTLRQGLETCQHDVEIHRSLAERLQSTGQYEAAFVEWQRLLPRAATDAGVWRGMAQALLGGGRSVEAAVPCSTLVVLGKADERELSVARQQRLRPGTARAASFTDPVLRQLSVFSDLEVEEQIVQVLRAAAPAVDKLWPLDFQAYGVSVRDKIPARSDNAMIRRAQALADAFEVEDFDLYVFASTSNEVVVESHDNLALMVPEALLGVSETQQIYALARAFASVKHGSYLAFTVGQERVRNLFLAAMRYAQPGAGRDSLSDDELSLLHRRLHKALGWRARSRAEGAARACTVISGNAFEAWVQSVAVVRRRAAALITNDLPEVVALEERERVAEGHLVLGDGTSLSSQSEKLLASWGSPKAFEVRAATGIL